QLRITCADAIELMTDFLDDALSRRDLKNFQEHLTLCGRCRVYLDQIRRTTTLTPRRATAPSKSRLPTSTILPPRSLAAPWTRNATTGRLSTCGRLSRRPR